MRATGLPSILLIVILKKMVMKRFGEVSVKKIGTSTIKEYMLSKRAKVALLIVSLDVFFSVGLIISMVSGLTGYYSYCFQEVAKSLSSIVGAAGAIAEFSRPLEAISIFLEIVGKESFASILEFIAAKWMDLSILPALIGGAIGGGLKAR